VTAAVREEDLDQVIAAWDERLRRVDENLIALEADPTYQMLGGSARATLRGKTKDRVVPALEALGELFEHRERLNTVVVRAKELRAEVSFWNKDEKLAEIAALLGGPSITLGTRQLPVAQRNLLDPATTDVAVVPEELLSEMVRAYQVARDAVAEVAAAWARVEPRLLELEREVALVTDEATGLGQIELTRGPLERVTAELARVRGLVSTDPLAVDGAVDAAIVTPLRELRASLAELAGHKATVTRGFGQADALLASLDEAVSESTKAASRAEREFSGFSVSASARSGRQEIILGLRPWREKIAAAAAAGHFRSASVGLTRWLEVARGVLEAEREVVTTARQAEATRTELEGRLSARRAQAAALIARGPGGAASAELDELARKADRALQNRPTDLAEARRQVDRYESAVRALGTGGRVS
jgi:hypothetical protein